MIANLKGRKAVMFTSDFPDRVKQKTGVLFRRDKLNCAESVFKALLEESGNSCPLELLRTASAFGRGMGGSGLLLWSAYRRRNGYWFSFRQNGRKRLLPGCVRPCCQATARSLCGT